MGSAEQLVAVGQVAAGEHTVRGHIGQVVDGPVAR